MPYKVIADIAPNVSGFAFLMTFSMNKIFTCLLCMSVYNFLLIRTKTWTKRAQLDTTKVRQKSLTVTQKDIENNFAKIQCLSVIKFKSKL